MKGRSISEGLKRVAAEELNEDPKKIPFYIKAIRDWLQEQPHLRSIQASDQWLIGFLRGSKYNLDKCKKKLDKYYTLKSAAPEFFTNRDPLDPSMQAMLKAGIFLPLRNCVTEDGPRPCLVRMSEQYKSKRPLSDLIKISFMFAELMLLEDDNFNIAGQIVLVDLSDTGLTLLTQFSPSVARKTFLYAERALTVRMKSIYVLNMSRGLKATLNVIKMLLGQKIRNRLQIYDENYGKLYNYVPESILPAEYGGDMGDVQELTDYWKTKMESYRSWFLLQDENFERVTANINTRSPSPTATENNEENRTFRRLELD